MELDGTFFELKQQLVYVVGCLDEWLFQVIDANIDKNICWWLHHFQSFDCVDSIPDVRGSYKLANWISHFWSILGQSCERLSPPQSEIHS